MTLFSVNRQPHILSMGLLLCCRLAMKDIFFSLSLALTFLFIYPSSLWSSTNMSAPPFMILSFFCIYRAVVIFWCTKIYHFAFSFLSTNKKTVSHLQFMSQLIHIANLMLQQPLRKCLLSNSQVLDLILKISVASEVTVFSLFTSFLHFWQSIFSFLYLYLF